MSDWDEKSVEDGVVQHVLDNEKGIYTDIIVDGKILQSYYDRRGPADLCKDGVWIRHRYVASTDGAHFRVRVAIEDEATQARTVAALEIKRMHWYQRRQIYGLSKSPKGPTFSMTSIVDGYLSLRFPWYREASISGNINGICTWDHPPSRAEYNCPKIAVSPYVFTPIEPGMCYPPPPHPNACIRARQSPSGDGSETGTSS